MATIYIVQHGDRERRPGDPGLTGLGRRQAEAVAEFLGPAGLTALYSSPLARARQTALPIGEATGLPIRVDDRLTERMNWNGDRPFGEFLANWRRTVADRDFVPADGDSSRRAGDRFLSFIDDWRDHDGAIAVTAHGGVTVDLLRTLLGDDAIDPRLCVDGVPCGAITTLTNRRVGRIAAVGHL